MPQSNIISNPFTITSGSPASFDVVIDGSLKVPDDRTVFIHIQSGSWKFSQIGDAANSPTTMTTTTNANPFPLNLVSGKFSAQATAAGVSFNIFW